MKRFRGRPGCPAGGSPTSSPTSRCARLAPVTRLAAPAPPKAETDAASYLLFFKSAAADISARTVELAGDGDPKALRAGVRKAVADLEVALADVDLSRAIPTRLAPMRLDDFLITRCVEGVVHGLDLEPCGRS